MSIDNCAATPAATDGGHLLKLVFDPASFENFSERDDLDLPRTSVETGRASFRNRRALDAKCLA